MKKESLKPLNLAAKLKPSTLSPNGWRLAEKNPKPQTARHATACAAFGGPGRSQPKQLSSLGPGQLAVSSRYYMSSVLMGLGFRV